MEPQSPSLFPPISNEDLPPLFAISRVAVGSILLGEDARSVGNRGPIIPWKPVTTTAVTTTTTAAAPAVKHNRKRRGYGLSVDGRRRDRRRL